MAKKAALVFVQMYQIHYVQIKNKIIFLKAYFIQFWQNGPTNEYSTLMIKSVE